MISNSPGLFLAVVITINRPSTVLTCIDDDCRSHGVKEPCLGPGITVAAAPSTLFADGAVRCAFSDIQKQVVDKEPGRSRSGHRGIASGEEDLILIEDWPSCLTVGLSEYDRSCGRPLRSHFLQKQLKV